MSVKKGLGKGLGALLGEQAVSQVNWPASQGEDAELVLSIDINALDPNPFQPRADFDEQALEELRDSIAVHGVLQPLLVIRGQGGRYTIIAGERRWRAARKAGLTSVPAVLKDFDDRQLREAALIENLQRSDLNPVEEAQAVSALMENYALTQEEVAMRVGKSRSAIANALRVLTLPPALVQMVRDGRLTSGHARAVLSAPAHQQVALAERILEQGLNVRQAEALAAAMKQPPAKKPDTAPVDPHFAATQATLSRRYGTKVAVQGSLSRGKIVFEYFSREDLERLCELFGATE